MRKLACVALCVAFSQTLSLSANARNEQSTTATAVALAPRLPADIYKEVSASLCSVVARNPNTEDTALGSGFVVSDGGDVVTSAHVVLGRPEIAVKCAGEIAEVVALSRFSKLSDLVQLKTKLTDAKPLTISSEPNTAPGTAVLVFGNPEGLEGTVSSGIVSAIRTINGVQHIQITAPISAGSSGGPVVDDRGNVVGIATATLEAGQNLNFAVAVSELLSLAVAERPLSDLGSFQPLRESSEPKAAENNQLPHAAREPLQFRGTPIGASCGEIARRLNRKQLGPFASSPPFSSELIEWLEMPLTELTWFHEQVTLNQVFRTALYACNSSNRFVLGVYDQPSLAVDPASIFASDQTKELEMSLTMLTARHGEPTWDRSTRSNRNTLQKEVYWQKAGSEKISLYSTHAIGSDGTPGVAQHFFIVYYDTVLLSNMQQRYKQKVLDQL